MNMETPRRKFSGKEIVTSLREKLHALPFVRGEGAVKDSGSETTNPLPKPEKYIFVGAVVENPKKLAEARAKLEGYKVDLPQGVDVPPERAGQVAEMVGVLGRFGKEQLGVDLSNTLTRPGQVHFYDRETYNRISLIERPEIHEGETYPTGEIAIVEAATTANTLAITNHELMHGATPTLLSVSEGVIRNHPRVLYHNGQSLDMVEEVVVELTNLELRTNHWRDNPTLKDHIGGDIGYIESVIVGEELLKRVADSHGGLDPLKGVLRPLQKGLVLGQSNAADIIAEAVGPKAMETIVNWRENNTAAAMKVARDLNLKDAQRKIKALTSGQPVRWFESISPGEITTTIDYHDR